MFRRSPVRPRLLLALIATAILTVPAADAATSTTRRRARRPVKPPDLVWYVESSDGEVVDAKSQDVAINPASVIKIATSWWALETLGPDHRFTTRFASRGTIDFEKGVLKGDLVVHGDGDPEFQPENAMMVAQALNRMGIHRVTGAVVVDKTFWMGWENGSQGRLQDPARRGVLMATRLRVALEPRKWTRANRDAWRAYAIKSGIPVYPPPSVAVLGGGRFETSSKGPETLLFEHRSKPLAETLRRFNAFSNNDMERVADSIGPASEL